MSAVKASRSKTPAATVKTKECPHRFEVELDGELVDMAESSAREGGVTLLGWLVGTIDRDIARRKVVV